MNENEKEYDWGSNIEETYELNDIARELLIVNQTTIERLFAEKNQNALVLYLFYYKTAKWQNTTVIRASDKYCKECLHWGIDKLQLAKKTLINMKLIEIIKKKDTQNRISGWFVKINYLQKTTIPISTIPISPDVVKQDTNAIYNNYCEKKLYNNINAYSNSDTAKYLISSNWSENLTCETLTKKGEQCSRRSSYNINGKNYCNQHSREVLNVLFDNNNKNNPPTLEEIENYCKERKNNVNAKKFFDYYNEGGWKDQNGKPVKNWKQKMIANWENKSETKVNNNYSDVEYTIY